MNRNQKIAIGCGGAGCLGLILLAALSLGGYLYYYQSAPSPRSRNTNININSNRPSNSNASNSNSSNSNSTNTTEDPPSSSTSADDKHKLFQAVNMTQDAELVTRVLRKMGFETGGSAYDEFLTQHAVWAANNTDFVLSVATPAKARAYVEAHIND